MRKRISRRFERCWPISGAVPLHPPSSRPMFLCLHRRPLSRNRRSSRIRSSLLFHPRHLRQQTPMHRPNCRGRRRPSVDRALRIAPSQLIRFRLPLDRIIQGPFAACRMAWVDSGAWRAKPRQPPRRAAAGQPNVQLENLRRRSSQPVTMTTETTMPKRSRPPCRNGESLAHSSPEP